MNRFTIPRDIYFGDDALDCLKDVTGKKAVIVIGSQRLIKDGTVPKIQEKLQNAHIESVVFSGVEPDPSVETVEKGAAFMADEAPDLIIGVGGGSPIDAAKAMWIFYEQPQLTFAAAAEPFSLPQLRQKARFIAIPTTSGTASEVTSFAVISDNKSHIKYPLADFNLTPDIAILDTSLVQKMPLELTANTGMDALTHAIEAYVSTVSNPITDSLAIKAIEMVIQELPASYAGDKTARENMHIAQCLAGMSFSNAILGIVHSMAHKTGKVFNIPHGLANAIYLPYVMQFNAKQAPKKYADIARRLFLKGDSDQERIDALIEAVRNLRQNVGIKNCLKDYGVSEEHFQEQLDFISDNAIADPCTGTNPRPVTRSEMRKLFEAVYYGKNVDF